MGVHRRFGLEERTLSLLERYDLILLSSLPEGAKEILTHLNFSVNDECWISKGDLTAAIKDVNLEFALDWFLYFQFEIIAPDPDLDGFIILFHRFPFEPGEAKDKSRLLLYGPPLPEVKRNINPHTSNWARLLTDKVDIEKFRYPIIVTDFQICPPLWAKGVYILLDDEVVVYVGMSNKCIASRLRKHARHGQMKFNGYTILNEEDLRQSSIEESEKELIDVFRPKYNKTFFGEPRQIRVFDVEVAA